MASPTVETEAPSATDTAPLTEAETRHPQASAATAHEEPLLLPEVGETPASYPASSVDAGEKAAAPPAQGAAPERAAKASAQEPAASEIKPQPAKKEEKPSPEVDALNLLLRGELAAIETYRQALDKAAKETGAAELEALQRDHRDASGLLWQRIQKLAGEPAKSSGAWGAFAKAIEGAAKLFGDVTALAILKEGEEHGAGSYRDALEGTALGSESKDLVRPLLAKQQEHVAALVPLIARAGAAPDTAKIGADPRAERQAPADERKAEKAEQRAEKAEQKAETAEQKAAAAARDAQAKEDEARRQRHA
jgi:Domain of unknown function (DUF2383)